MGRFYVPSSGRGQRLKLAKQLSGDIALQAPLDVADGLALSEATLDVVLCGAVLTHADQHDGVERHQAARKDPNHKRETLPAQLRRRPIHQASTTVAPSQDALCCDHRQNPPVG